LPPPELPEASLPPVRPTKADICRIRSALLHCGQTGWSLPMTSASNACPQSRQTKSRNGMGMTLFFIFFSLIAQDNSPVGFIFLSTAERCGLYKTAGEMFVF
jgi:hypothetical protein